MENRDDAQFRSSPEGVMTAFHRSPLRRLFRAWATALLVLLAALSTPAVAHKGEKHESAQQTQVAGSPTGAAPAGSGAAAGQAMGGMDMGGMDGGGMEMNMDRSNMPFFQRLLDWFGRLHPFLVHFPIAFFPAALLTAIAGRRRPSFAAPVQFLVIAGALFAPFAAASGWLGGMTADPEPILPYHRWLGVSVAIVGVGLGIWAWRRPWEDRGAGMILALTIMTIAILIQGFLGAGLTHGIQHLMF